MIKSFFNRFDLFPAQVSLRNKGGAAVRNPYTGFFSFLLSGWNILLSGYQCFGKFNKLE